MRLPSGWASSVNWRTVRSTSSPMFRPVAIALRTSCVGQVLVLEVEVEVLERQPDVELAGHVGQGLDLGHQVELGLGVDQVDLVVLQRRRLGGRLGQEPEHDRVEVRLGPEVLLVAGQGQALALLPAGDDVGAVGGDLLRGLVQPGVPAAGHLGHVLGREQAVEQRLPVGEGLGEDHRDRLAVVGALDALDLVVAGGRGHVVVLDRPVEVLPQVLEVVGAHRGAVRPDGLLLDLVDDRLGVGAGLRGRVHQLLVELDGKVGMEAEHRREHVDDDIEHRGAVVLGGVVVEPGRLLVGGVAEGAALPDRVAGPALSASPAVTAAGGDDEGERDGEHGQPERPSALDAA